jgi:hypothetical protein
MHRCHINTRRVEVQEARLERDEEKTEEQLHFKFMEWAENPAIRRALILEPMEANRQTRQKFGVPPTSDDILVEKLTRNDPYFNPPSKKQNKYKPKPAENSHPEAKSSPPSEPQGGSSIQPGVGTPVPTLGSHPDNSPNPEGVESKPSQPSNPYGDKTTSQLIAEIEEQTNREKAARLNPSSEKTPDVQEQKNTVGTRCCASGADQQVSPPAPQGESAPDNSKLKTQNSTLSKPALSAYERAPLEGKTHLEALYIHQAPESAKADSPRRSPARRDEDGSPNTNTQPTPPAQGTSAWDSFSQPVRPSPYAWASHHATSGFQLRYG